MKLLKLALRNIFRNKRRTILTMISVIISTFSLLILSGYINASKYFWSDSLIHYQYGHMQIFKKGYLEGENTSFKNSITLKEKNKIYEICQKNNKILLTMERVNLVGLIGTETSSSMFFASGMQAEKERMMANYDNSNIIKGKNLSGKEKTGVVLPSIMAKRMELKIDDEILLMGQSIDNSFEAVAAKVRGIANYSVDALNENLVLFPIELTKDITLTDNIHSMPLLLESREDIFEVKNYLQNEFKENNLNLEIKTWLELAKEFRQVIKMFNNIFGIITLILVILVIVLVSNTIFMSIMERTREIATMKSIGINKFFIFLLIVLEGSFICFFGGIFGIILAKFFSIIINYFNIVLPPFPGQSAGTFFKVILNYSMFLKIIVLNLFLGIFGSIIPAIKSTQINIVKGLRYD